MTDDARDEGRPSDGPSAAPAPPPPPAAGPPPPDPGGRSAPAPAAEWQVGPEGSGGLPGWVRLAAAAVSTLVVIGLALVRSGLLSPGAVPTDYAAGTFIGGVIAVFAVGAIAWAVIRHLRRDQGGLSPLWIPVIALALSLVSAIGRRAD